MDRYSIINLKQKGISNRQVSRELGVDRKTVARIWNAYRLAQEELHKKGVELTAQAQEELTDQIVNHSYNSNSRNKRKLTPEVLNRLHSFLGSEEDKTKQLGKRHKQKPTCRQMHQMLVEEGVDIGLTTVTNAVRDLREARDVYVKQTYDLGQRLEYDFGEVRLVIGGKARTYYLAVLASPTSAFRWAYLYPRQDQKVFLDSHVRFFAMVGGVWQEVVYDNMRNVVKRFIGRNEKALNENLVNLALYYQYEINVTNRFSGNEKGYVESSVKKIRNTVFAPKYKFESFAEAEAYLERELLKLNQDSLLE